MVARGEQEEEEVMDDRVGRVVAREARIRYMVAWLRAGGLQGKLSWAGSLVSGTVPLGLGLGLGWTVSLACHRCHWRMFTTRFAFLGWRSFWRVPGYGRYDDPRSGSRVLGSGSGLLFCWVSV